MSACSGVVRPRAACRRRRRRRSPRGRPRRRPELDGGDRAGDGEVAVTAGELGDAERRSGRSTPGTRSPSAARRRSSAVDHTPVEELRRRHRPRSAPPTTMSNVASRATATAGYSAAGSAWANEPPIVPRLRIWKWPMYGVTAARSGYRGGDGRVVLDDRVAGGGADRRASRCGARSPAARPMRPMSTRCSKRARRRLSIGTRLWPPASTLASSPSSASESDGLVDGRRGVVLERSGLHRLVTRRSPSATTSGSSSSETWPPLAQQRLVAVDAEVGDQADPLLDGQLQLGAGEVRAEAAVLAGAEGDVPVRRALDDHLVGVRERRGDRGWPPGSSAGPCRPSSSGSRGSRRPG